MLTKTAWHNVVIIYYIGYSANIEIEINDEKYQIHQRPKLLWIVRIIIEGLTGFKDNGRF